MSAFTQLEADAIERAAGFRELIQTKRIAGYDQGGRPIWELARPLFFWSRVWQCWLMVPAGFRTNYASVPRLPFVYWWYGERCWEEPALHDFAYTEHAIFKVAFADDGSIASVVRVEINREQADDLFLEALQANPKTSGGMADVMHRGVRLGGQSSWDDPTSIAQADYHRELALSVT